jgi:hypothetical protein
MSVPSIPLIEIRPTVSNETIQFFWSPPESDGGSPITQYVLSDGTNTYYQESGPTYIVNPLINGQDYTFTLAASNAIGIGEAATFRTVQPGNPPTYPPIISITSTPTTAFIKWDTPFSDGGAQIKWYAVEAVPDNSYYSTIRYGALGTQRERWVSGLNPLTSYTYNVYSVNDPGYSSLNSVPFIPDMISGIQLWCDAISLSLQNDDPVTLWNPSGSASFGFTGNATFKTNVLGTKPVVQVNANQSMIDTTYGNFNFSPYTLFTVSRQIGGTNQRVFQEIYQNGLFGYWNQGKNDWYSGAGWINESQTPSDTNWDIYTFSKNNAGNALMNRFGNTLTSNVNNPTNLRGLGINTGTYASELSDSQIAEVILYSGELSYANIQRVEGYLAWKWGFQNNLPENHPYRNAIPMV